MTTDTRSIEQAFAQLETVRELVAAIRAADALDEPERSTKLDEVQQTIYENALSTEVRSGWHIPGRDKLEAAEYRILLCTGGPAVQISGNIGDHGEPETARLEHQDWGTPWQRVPLSDEAEADLLAYAQSFYFGE